MNPIYRIVLTRKDRTTSKNIVELVEDRFHPFDIQKTLKSILQSTIKLISLSSNILGIRDFDISNVYIITNKNRYRGYIFYKDIGVIYTIGAYKIKWPDGYKNKDDETYLACIYRSYTISTFYDGNFFITNEDGVVVYHISDNKKVKELRDCLSIIDNIWANNTSKTERE